MINVEKINKTVDAVEKLFETEKAGLQSRRQFQGNSMSPLMDNKNARRVFFSTRSRYLL